MAFCTKCGAEIAAEAKFCTKCGASSGEAKAVAPAAAPAARAPAAPAPTAAQAAPSGGGAWKVVLIILAVFVGLGVLGSLVAGLAFWRVARSVNVDSKKGEVSIATPGGKIKVGATQAPVSEAELGLPIYPGATQQQEASVEVTSEKGSMHTYVFKTSDAPQKVMAFYREKLGTTAASYVESPDGGVITSEGRDKKEGFWITIGRDGDETVITIVRGRNEKSPATQ